MVADSLEKSHERWIYLASLFIVNFAIELEPLRTQQHKNSGHYCCNRYYQPCSYKNRLCWLSRSEDPCPLASREDTLCRRELDATAALDIRCQNDSLE